MIQSRRSEWLVWCLAVGVAVWGCSTNDSGTRAGDDASLGGTTAVDSGGTPASGGTSVMGGIAATGGNVGTGGAPATGGVFGAGGTLGSGGAPTTGGVPGSGGAQSTGGRVGTGGAQSTAGSGGSSPSGACSATAPVGLEVGMLIPDMQVQHCDGTWVSLHDLVCGNVLTQVYSFASWCPGCQSFAGLVDGGSSMGNSLYDRYHAKGFEQVIILSATSQYGQAPTAQDCADLQALLEGLVVFDATGKKTQDVLGLKINGGTGLVDAEGLWVVAPPVDAPQDGGLTAVFTELRSRFGRGTQ